MDLWDQDTISNLKSDIESGTLRKEILNCKSLNDLSTYFDINTIVKQCINDDNFNFNVLLEKVDKINHSQQLAKILNLNYWCKPDIPKLDFENIKRKFREELTSGNFIKKIKEINAVKDLASYFNLDSEEAFVDLVQKIKNDKIRDIDSGDLLKLVSKPDVSLDELKRVFEIIHWTRFLSFGQEIVDEIDFEMTDNETHDAEEEICHDALETS